jgi:N-terminal domain of anti-restriction factor ArdC
MMNREDALKASDDALKELADALRQGKSEKLVEYLGLMSRFHHYSFGNCILIAIQKPDATHVAGFGRWKDLGRFVRKGEKGISILAPLVGKRKEDEVGESSQAEQSTDKPQAGKVVFGFRVVHVFDVSQTEGQELPEFAKLSGDPGEKFERLEVIIKSYGIALEYVESLPFNANGMSEGGKISPPWFMSLLTSCFTGEIGAIQQPRRSGRRKRRQ